MRRIYDRLAALFITLGGVAIIAGVLAVFVFILLEVLPLFSSPSYGAARQTLPAPSVEGAIGMGVDEHRQTAYAVFPSGDIRLFSAATGGVVATVPTGAPARSFAVHTTAEFFVAGGEDGEARVTQSPTATPTPERARPARWKPTSALPPLSPCHPPLWSASLLPYRLRETIWSPRPPAARFFLPSRKEKSLRKTRLPKRPPRKPQLLVRRSQT